MERHTLSAFDTQLDAIAEDIDRMGAAALELVKGSIAVLAEGDVERARQLVGTDRAIDELQHQIEQQTVLALARNQPMAVDLRVLVSAMRVANDLERIGDLAKNIAKRTIVIDAPVPSDAFLTGFRQLSRLVLAQLVEVLEAYRKRDGAMAEAVRQKDGEVDAVHTALFRELLTYMLEDTRNIAVCAHLLFCAKNMERIGDHATNIAETLTFVLTGEMPEDDRPKADPGSGEG